MKTYMIGANVSIGDPDLDDVEIYDNWIEENNFERFGELGEIEGNDAIDCEGSKNQQGEMIWTLHLPIIVQDENIEEFEKFCVVDTPKNGDYDGNRRWFEIMAEDIIVRDWKDYLDLDSDRKFSRQTPEDFKNDIKENWLDEEGNLVLREDGTDYRDNFAKDYLSSFVDDCWFLLENEFELQKMIKLHQN